MNMKTEDCLSDQVLMRTGDMATVMGCVSLFFGIVTEDAGWSHEKCSSDLHCAPSALRYCCCKTDLEVSLITMD